MEIKGTVSPLYRYWEGPKPSPFWLNLAKPLGGLRYTV